MHAGDQPVCECHQWPVSTFDNVGWSGWYPYKFSRFQDRATGKQKKQKKQNSIPFSHPNAQQRLMTNTYVGEKYTKAGCLAPCLRCFHLILSGNMRINTSNICNACRQADTRTDLLQIQTRQEAMNLCRTTNIPCYRIPSRVPSVFSPLIALHDHVYRYNYWCH